MCLINRIYQLSDFKGDSIYKISKDIGVSNGYFAKTRKNNGNVSSNIIEKIVSYYPDLNVEWLITGNGNILKTKSEKKVINLNDNLNDNLIDNKPKVKKRLPFLDMIRFSETGAPYYNKPVSAGALSLQYDQIDEDEIMGYIDIPGIKCKAYFPVVGFSFKPTIMPGDIIGVADVERLELLDPDCIYFIITHHERMIKHLRDHPNNKELLTCISPNLKEFDLPKNEVLEVYKVIFYGRLT